MTFLVMIEHSTVDVGHPSTEFAVYEHPIANDVSGAWRRVRDKYAKHGDTVSMGVVTNRCVPATHVDVVVG